MVWTRMGMASMGGGMVGSHRREVPRAPWHRDAAAEAGRLVRSRFTAWNRADWAALRALLHVPHVSLPGHRLAVRESEGSLLGGGDPRRPASTAGWHHSRLERVDIRRCSPDKAHCAVTFGKNADGRRYADAEAVAVVTRRDGRWGIQLSSVTLRPIGVGRGDHADAVAAATGALRRWLAAEDAADTAAMRPLIHLPFVELRGSELVVHRSAASLRRAAGRRLAASGRDRREIHRVEVRERSARKVTLEADIARLGPGDALVGCDAALVILTEQQGRWALQVQSIF
jgi:hypothetical protein